MRRERLILIGVASCNPGTAERLIAAGRMPNLARIRQHGAWGRLLGGEPLIGPSMWTTIATGRQPEHHDVLSLGMPRPDGGGIATVGHAAWRAPSIWQALAAVERPVLTVGWTATWPATDWPGIHVDARFAAPTGPDFEAWSLPLGCVRPTTLRERLRGLRLHPIDVTSGMLAPLVPRLAEVDQYRDARLTELAAIIATTVTLHSAATDLIEHQAWDLACVQYPLLDDIYLRFGHLAGDPIWGGVVDAAYAFVDAMLGRVLALVDPDTSLWLVSPNGVRVAGGAVTWTRSGLIAARGRWVEPGGALAPASLVDVAPSVLARFGLTMPSDGAVIRPLAPGRSQRPVEVPMVSTRPPDRHVDALRAAGYDDTPSAAEVNAIALVEARRLRRRGEALFERGRLHEAETVLREARAKLPTDLVVLRRLAMCAVMRGDAAACRAIGGDLLTEMPHGPWGYVAVAAGFALEGDAASAWPHMAKAEDRGGMDAELLVRLGGVALMLREDLSATRYFARALELDPQLEGAQRGMAMAQALRDA